MQTQDEKTQQVILDGLDTDAVIIIGLTSQELVMIFGSSLLFYVILFLLVLGMMGIPIGLAIGLAQGWVIGKKIGRMKQGRPSELLFGEIKRNIQLNGLSLFGITKIKIPFGFIDDKTWDNQSHIFGNEVKLLPKNDRENLDE
ncbi:DUF3487 family protein [Photobacterium damselae]|uniref:DUF3487 family protein n=1 Tax=Photobacterium damselae TaxID=38293 RepID=UPI0040675E75